MFDVKTLTLGEVAKVEELSQLPITVMGEDDRPKGLLTAALAFVIRRREDPTFTWGEALALTLDQANEVIGIKDDADDSEPANDEGTAPDPT